MYLILTGLVIVYIDNGIRTHDMDFYFGKDNGYIERFKSIIGLNVSFFILMTIWKKQKLTDYMKAGLLGLATALTFGIVCYLVFLDADYYGLTYHIATIILCYSSYFVLKNQNWC